MTVVELPRPGRPERARLFPDQAEAVERLARHLRRAGTRGLFVSATGTGKTLVSIRTADELGARLVLFVVPTLDLAAQTALAWRRDGHLEHLVIVSSLDTSGRDDLVAARIMSTTEPHALGGLMSVVGKGEDQIPALTVICTYDSLDKIEQTQRTGYTVPPFDLAVMDEAHRIAGRADKKWAIVNDAQRICTDRRLYMTATPRIFAAPELAESADVTRPRRRTPAADTDVDAFANSMDNEAVYGKKVFEYPLAQAVEDGRAADYRIVVPTLTDADLRRRLNLPTPGGNGDGESDGPDSALRTTALHLSVLRAMTEHGLKKVLVYFNLVSDARRFTRELPHTLRLLARTDPDLVPDITPELFFAHGQHTPAQRAGTFAAFAAADCAILANSRLIAEGVDIPSVDAIAFADPTRSVIRCVQALGRALRLDVSGKTASLIVPVYVPPGADGENILGTAYEPVWAIACALASHDHRILERLPDKANRLPRETSDVIARRWHFDFTVHPERIAQAMDLASFHPREAALSRSRRLGLAAAQSYRDQYGHLDVPADHIDPTGYTLGTFITTMRDAAKAGRLEADWTAELDALGMIWDKHDAAWRSRLTAAADYHRTHGHLAAPATTSIGAWLAEQRHLAGRQELPAQRADTLNALAPDWRLPHGADWHRKYGLLRAHLADGADPAALARDTLLAGVKIGSWLHRQLTTWHTLHPGQQQLMTALGLTPERNPLTPVHRTRRSFEETVQLLELFLHREGRAPAARESIRVDGDTVRIGAWLAKARTKHRAGQLPEAHAHLVATLFDGDWTTEGAVPAAVA
ncbi:DEAD/DEAH box helicase [Streptomyces stelliscabiei]|uniref:DEAD/DEAH box helicase n=1 Tax=Streptomyces stelliscabiei TaxID=146820 RepID=UPI0029B7DE98|nr:Helicase associated domain protein [Streptomyces stelliscabiei]MDX2557249.1 Helicase associated domain protein [Streptomyces stelliscabiei]MDX2616361.1 Helicase associated domain protein [Streptomyces stelliscabiei]MDX2641062.1 Helicase associated domain protein [Streptomyces stelliscabiei]MDX2665124.1 Helicase associated domain protein [Streptomyces stelliscabiei]MDX2716201.1 Helicase associated domain protein [Streptomyces stelliscabiei]